MGQSYCIANLDKKEFIFPHQFGPVGKVSYGYKLWEIAASDMAGVYAFLTRCSDEIGAGGDIRKEYTWADHWAGDRIITVGDYCDWKYFTKKTGIKKDYKYESPYDWIRETFSDISPSVYKDYADFMDFDKKEEKEEIEIITPRTNMRESEMEGLMDEIIRMWDRMSVDEKIERYEITREMAEDDPRELPAEVFEMLIEDATARP